MPSLIDLTGRRFGRLEVIKQGGFNNRREIYWWCKCDCGQTRLVIGSSLRIGRTTSCGCHYRKLIGERSITHGYSCNRIKRPEFEMYHAAKRRAKQQNVPFDLKMSDIQIPELCPVLGIPLKCGKGKLSDNSATIDRLLPHLGYVKGNIKVISFKANTIKHHATLEELKRVASWLEQELSLTPIKKQGGI